LTFFLVFFDLSHDISVELEAVMKGEAFEDVLLHLEG
jgi:hypothetical protein